MARRYFAVTFGTYEWFNKASNGEIDVANSPPNRSPNMRGMRESDPVLVLTFGERKFIGEFSFKEAMKVNYGKFERDCEERAFETARASFPSPGDRCWVMVFDKVRSYRRAVYEEDMDAFPELDRNKVYHIFKGIRGFSPFKQQEYWEIMERIREVGGK